MIKRLLLIGLIVLAIPTVSRETTLYNLRTSVYDLLSTDSTNRIIDTLLVDRCINLAVPVVSTDARCVVAHDRSKLQKFVVEYFIDSAMVKDGVLDAYIKNIDNAKLTSLFGLVRRDIEEFGRSGDKIINIYDVVGYNIVLYNVPQVTDTTDSLIVAYAKRGTRLDSASQVTDIIDDYKQALLYKACEFIFLNRRLDAMADFYSGLYDKEISKKRSINPPDSLGSVVPGR